MVSLVVMVTAVVGSGEAVFVEVVESVEMMFFVVEVDCC